MTNTKTRKTVVNVGVDVGKASLDIVIHEKGLHWQEDNTLEGIGRILKSLSYYQVVRLVMEATGRYEFELAQAAYNKGRQSVDDYLELCESLGRDPDREYSGRIPLRIDAALHRRVAIAADSAAKSVNAWITDALETATEPRRSDTTRTRKRRRGARKATG